MKEFKKFILILSIFLGVYYFPIDLLLFRNPIFEAIALLKWYAREHVILCLIPSFFIAGAISVFISQASVMKYFGAKANKVLAYGVASISGTILAVCSCTVLPIFSGIYKRGAGLGPAISFLYSGPAINALAIIITARVLGWEIGFARAIGAVIFSVVIGLLMHFIFLKEERARHTNNDFKFSNEEGKRSLLQTLIYFISLIGILIFANWGKPVSEIGIWAFIYSYKWVITIIFSIILTIILPLWFTKKDLKEWTSSSWTFAKQIMPLLFIGVLFAGFALGRPGHEGIIPSTIIKTLVGGNSLFSNFFASIVGAFMYFATLTEVPIVQGLLGAGMGKGPALALLLAGPALSLPNMLVIRGVLGTKKTIVYVTLVILMATISGIFFGKII